MIFPRVADITFPLQNLRSQAVKTGKEFWAELHKLDENEGQAPASGSSTQPPSGDAEPIEGAPAKDPKPRQAKITFARMLELGPTIGIPGVYCKQCEKGIGDHSAGCRERFNKAYQHKDDKKDVTVASPLFANEVVAEDLQPDASRGHPDASRGHPDASKDPGEPPGERQLKR